MGVAYHTIYTPDGAPVNLFDRVIIGIVQAVYGAGTTTGVATSVAVTWSEPIATPYFVVDSKVEAGSTLITSKTATGFTFTMTPGATVTLAGGTVELLIVS
jgi:hypothetical protein